MNESIGNSEGKRDKRAGAKTPRGVNGGEGENREVLKTPGPNEEAKGGPEGPRKAERGT